jgi:hypothetical protein
VRMRGQRLPRCKPERRELCGPRAGLHAVPSLRCGRGRPGAEAPQQQQGPDARGAPGRQQPTGSVQPRHVRHPFRRKAAQEPSAEEWTSQQSKRRREGGTAAGRASWWAARCTLQSAT